MEVTLNIENYLSDNDKKDIAQDEYRRIIREELKTSNFGSTLNKKDRLSNAERLMSNAVYYILENESEELLGKSINLKEEIKKNVTNTILKNKDYTYSIFKEKGIFQKEDSLGQKILNQAIENNKDFIKEKVKNSINKFFEKDERYLTDWMNEAIGEVLLEKLKK